MSENPSWRQNFFCLFFKICFGGIYFLFFRTFTKIKSGAKYVGIFMTILSTSDFANNEDQTEIFHSFTMHAVSSDTIKMKKKTLCMNFL